MNFGPLETLGIIKIEALVGYIHARSSFIANNNQWKWLKSLRQLVGLTVTILPKVFFVPNNVFECRNTALT
jgi:hypothetical protein